MDKNIPLKATYIILFLAVFIITTSVGYGKELIIGMFMLMSIITFPISLLTNGLIYISIVIMQSFYIFVSYDSAFTYLIFWFVFVITGYIQWFYIIPYLRKSVKK